MTFFVALGSGTTDGGRNYVKSAENFVGADDRMACVAHKAKNVIDKWLADEEISSFVNAVDQVCFALAFTIFFPTR